MTLSLSSSYVKQDWDEILFVLHVTSALYPTLDRKHKDFVYTLSWQTPFLKLSRAFHEWFLCAHSAQVPKISFMLNLFRCIFKLITIIQMRWRALVESFLSAYCLYVAIKRAPGHRRDTKTKRKCGSDELFSKIKDFAWIILQTLWKRGFAS